MTRFFLQSVLLLCGPVAWRSNVVDGLETAALDEDGASDDRLAGTAQFVTVSYTKTGMQPLVDVYVGGQWLQLVFDASSGNTAVFVKEAKACSSDESVPCYSFKDALKRGSVHICKENLNRECTTGDGSKYACDSYLENETNVTAAKPQPDMLMIDGIEYHMTGVEVKDDAGFSISLDGKLDTVIWQDMPLRLLVDKMSTKHSPNSLRLFDEASGILGASGSSLSCRNGSMWELLLKQQSVSLLAFDFYPPRQARYYKESAQSRLVFNTIDTAFEEKLVWSQPKQTGDIYNDGMQEFLIYHPKVCGIDLLYNTSSNWLAVIDTSGPCLTLPRFLFDRLRSRVKLDCPFAMEEPSDGRLCSPPRASGGQNISLPSIAFQLEDVQDPEPPRLQLPLERLVFNNGSQELLCVARADNEVAGNRNSADMMLAHIAVGSLAMSALYTVVNLDNYSIGLASRGDAETESSEDFCIESVTCISTMQTYFPPLNVCEDPPCSEYMFMTLDEETKVCKWTSAVPLSFGLLLAVLVALDLVSHKLYKQAIEKAGEVYQ